jgi:hypothetical protein
VIIEVMKQAPCHQHELLIKVNWQKSVKPVVISCYLHFHQTS